MRPRDSLLFLLLILPTVLAGCTVPEPAAPAPQGEAAAYAPPGAPSLGRADAPVTLVAFESPRCTGCRHFHVGGGPGNSTFDRLLATTIANGTARYVARTAYLGIDLERPLANAQRCAWHLGGAGAHHNLTSRLYRDLPGITANSVDGFLDSFAMSENLTGKGFRSCVEARTHEGEITKDLDDARALGVQGTPTFFVVDPTGKATRFDGVQSAATLQRAIAEARSRGAG